MIFKEFCREFATDEPIQIRSMYPIEFTPVENELIRRAHILSNNIKHKMDVLDRIEISYIEEKLKDKDAVVEILESCYHGEIPGFLPMHLTAILYDCDPEEFNNLSADKQQIIKTLAVYICISAKDKISKK